MKRSKFTDSQIREAIKRADAWLSVPEICQDLGISSATFYKWRARYGGMNTSMMARMKELKAENSRLKKMYAEDRLKTRTSGWSLFSPESPSRTPMSSDSTARYAMNGSPSTFGQT